jgi:ubiquinone/menaquinone biosynthesis C-methylase UbiE
MKRKMSDLEFRVMQGLMKLVDVVHPHVPVIAKSFGIQPGMTIVDYGCGPGRYAVEFSRLVGESGKVYAVDLLALAMEETEKRLRKNRLKNVTLKLAQDYDSGIPKGAADVICAVDMFHHVDPVKFLQEADRIAKPEGLLILSGGHLSRASIKKAVSASGLWDLVEENNRFLQYAKKKGSPHC